MKFGVNTVLVARAMPPASATHPISAVATILPARGVIAPTINVITF
jgi:hypothetical protein